LPVKSRTSILWGSARPYAAAELPPMTRTAARSGRGDRFRGRDQAELDDCVAHHVSVVLQDVEQPFMTSLLSEVSNV
jgi:hypothetical protein